MLKILAMESAKKLNFFPPKGGVSKYYSPRMILHQQSPDYAKHCSIPFGSYIQAHTEPDPTNTQLARTLDCIYLRYVDNDQGGHHLLDLRTGRTIKRRTVTTIPITANVVDLVHKMAENDGMTDNLKIQTKSGIILYGSTWIAGLVYVEDDENEEENEEIDEETVENQQIIDEMDRNKILDEVNPAEGVENNEENGENEEEIIENELNEEEIIENNEEIIENEEDKCQ
jgi:hypothetical protein